MISLKNVYKLYDSSQNYALKDVSVLIDDGEFVFLVGKSGAGKSTFIRLLIKEVDHTSGEILIEDYNLNNIKRRQISYLRREIGIVFQDYKLLENKTVFENVAFAVEIMGIKSDIIKKRVHNVLNMVGLRDKARKYPNQLSGGEQQRVAIARSIINKPKILICDEPTGNLDPRTSVGIMKLLNDINKTGTTLIIATHDKTVVDAMQRRVIGLVDGEIRSDQKGGYPH